MATADNIFADIKQRFDFAVHNDEQQYQLQLHSSRRLANQAVGYFVRAKENSIFRGQPMEKFDKEAAWRFADKWFFGAYLGQIARSVTIGYDQHQSWSTIQQGAELLALLADSAADHDPAGSYAQQLQASVTSPVHSLTQNGYTQSRLLHEFVSGEFTPTPDKALALSDYLQGIATLHSEKAALADMRQATPGNPAAISDTQKQAFRASALLNHASVAIQSEDYIRQDKTYLPAPAAEKIAKAILDTAAAQGITVLREGDSHGNGAARPLQLMKNGQPLSAQGIQAFHQQAMEVFRQHQADAALAAFGKDGVAEKELRANAPQKPAVKQRLVAWEKNTAPRSFAERAAHNMASAKAYLSRPQIIHETWKIYNRSVSNQLLAFPVNFFEEGLRYGVSSLFGKDAAKRLEKRDESGAKALLSVVGGRFSDGVTQADKDFMLRNFKANIFRFIVQPIAGGHGETFLKESFFAFSKGEAVLAEDKARAALDSGIADALKAMPDLGRRLDSIQHAHPAQLVLQAPEFADIPALLQKPEAQTSVADHRHLAEFFERLSSANLVYAEQALAPLGGGNQSMAERCGKALSQPVTTVAEAAIALALTRSVLDICREHHALVEYVAPEKRLMDPKKASQLAHFIEAETTKYTQGARTEADLVAYADTVAAHLSSSLNPQAVERLLTGRYSEHVSQSVEKKLFSPRQPQTAPSPARAAETSAWSGHAKRERPNRMGVVRERLASDELKKEIKRLHGRLQGEKWTGTASTLVQAKLRHQNALFDPGNLAYTAWTVLAYPIIYSKGLVAVRETWDEALFGKQTAIKEATQAMEHLSGAIDTALALDPQAANRFSQQTGVIPGLVALQHAPEYADISRICLKPESERSAAETEQMRGFFAKAGDRILHDTADVFRQFTGTAPAEGQSMESAIVQRLHAPADTLPDAIATLGFVQAILSHNSGQINVLAYLDPAERELKHGQVRDIAGFINDQAVLSGIADGKADAQTVIRFANVAAQKLAGALEKSYDKAPDFAERIAAKYASKTAETVSQRIG
jgi:hypothetical protein